MTASRARIRPRWRISRWLAIALLLIPALVFAPMPASAVTISSAGPLEQITISPDLNCDVRHTGDTRPSWYGSTACGTLASLNGTLYGPADIPAGTSASPRTPWTPVSQSGVTGSGTEADPFQVVTVVRNASGVTVTQTDTYVAGSELYNTTVTLTNNSGVTQLGQLYTAGDCYLQDDDAGYGLPGPAPACAVSTTPGSRIMSLVPRTGGNTWYQASYSQVWAAVGTQQQLPNTCRCTVRVDNGMAIAWPLSIPAGGSSTFEWSSVFSPTGDVPVTVSATAHAPESLPEDVNGYRITATNPNVADVTLDTITVTLPDGFAYVPGSTSGAATEDPVQSGSTLTFTGPFTVPAGGEIAFDYDVTVSSVAGTFTIDVDATAPPGTAVVGETNTAPITVLGVTDLAITKTASSGSVVAGAGSLSFTMTVSNVGAGTATGVTVVDAAPAGMTFNPGGSSPGCFALAGQVTCSVPDLAPGEDAEVTVAFTAPSTAVAGPRTNTAIVDADIDDPNPENNLATADFVVVRESDVSVTKTVAPAGSVPAGSSLTYTITVSNAGPSSADVSLVDAVPLGVTPVSLAGPGCSLTTVSCTFPLGAGGSAVITLVVAVSPSLEAGTTLVNRAQVTTTSTDSNPDNNVAEVATEVAPPEADLAIAKTLVAEDDLVVAGRTARYRLAVSNGGPSSATNVTVTDTLPEGTTFDATQSSNACSADDGTVTCTTPVLPADATDAFIVGIAVPPDHDIETPLVNAAGVAADEDDPVAGNNTVETSDAVERQVDVAVTKTTDADPVAGGPVAWTIIVTNSGPSDASDVVVTDPAIDGVMWTTAEVTDGTGTCAIVDGGMECTLDVVPANDGATITLTGDVDSGLAANTTLENEVTAQPAETDTNPANNVSRDAVNVTTEVGLHLSKDDGDQPAIAGDTITYTLTVGNDGPSDLPASVLTDDLPVGLSNVSFDAPAGVGCTLTDNLLTCDVDPVVAGAEVAITVTATLDAAAETGSELVNTATLTSTDGIELAQATEITPVERASTVAVSKAATSDPVIAGGEALWEVTVTNDGPSVVEGAVVLETPDAGFTVTAITGAGSTCDVAILECTLEALAPGESVVLQVTAAVSPDQVPGEYGNSATVLNPQGEDASDTATVTVIQENELTLDKLSDPDSVVSGDPLRYLLTVGNDGPSTATGVTLTDTLPAGVNFDAESSSAGCTAAGQIVTCDLGTLPVGDTQVVTIGAVSFIDLEAELENFAGVTADSGASATATATTVFAPEADLEVTKTAEDSIAGDDIEWTVAVTNAGSSTAVGATLQDTVDERLIIESAEPSEGTCATDGGTVTCDFGDIAPGSSVTVTIVTPTPPDFVPPDQIGVPARNTAVVDADTTDPDELNNTAIATVLVSAAADLVAAKDGPENAVAGETITYTMSVTNNGPSVATSVVVHDVLAESLTFLPEASDPRCTLTDPGRNEIGCSVQGSLDAGATETFTVTALVSPILTTGSIVVNAVTTAADQTDPEGQESPTVVTEIESIADLSVTKTPSADQVAAGSSFTYTIVITNNGPSAANQIELTDEQPAGSVPGRLTGGVRPGEKALPDCPGVGVRIQCEIPQLLPGDSITIVVPVDSDPQIPDGTVVDNTARVVSTSTDPNEENNADVARVTFLRQSDLALTKAVSVSEAAAGDDVQWTLEVTNLGPSQLDNVVVSDTLPVGLDLIAVDDRCTTSPASGGGTAVECVLDTLGPRATATFVIDTRVTDDAGPVIRNIATAAADGAPLVSADATVDVIPPPGEKPPNNGVDLPETGSTRLGQLLLFGLLLTVSGVALILTWRQRSGGFVVAGVHRRGRS